MKNIICKAAKGTNMIWKWLGGRGHIYESSVRLFYGSAIIALANVWVDVYTDFNKKPSQNLRHHLIEIIEQMYVENYTLSKAEFINFGWTERALLPCLLTYRM